MIDGDKIAEFADWVEHGREFLSAQECNEIVQIACACVDAIVDDDCTKAKRVATRLTLAMMAIAGRAAKLAVDKAYRAQLGVADKMSN